MRNLTREIKFEGGCGPIYLKMRTQMTTHVNDTIFHKVEQEVDRQVGVTVKHYILEKTRNLTR